MNKLNIIFFFILLTSCQLPPVIDQPVVPVESSIEEQSVITCTLYLSSDEKLNYCRKENINQKSYKLYICIYFLKSDSVFKKMIGFDKDFEIENFKKITDNFFLNCDKYLKTLSSTEKAFNDDVIDTLKVMLHPDTLIEEKKQISKEVKYIVVVASYCIPKIDTYKIINISDAVYSNDRIAININFGPFGIEKYEIKELYNDKSASFME